MSLIYVSEPTTINTEVVANTMPGSDHQLTLGDSDFSDSSSKPYDTILIRSLTTVGNDIKQHFPHLKNIIRVGTGLDNIDLGFCKQENISVFNAAGANADAVSEYVVSAALYSLRKFNLLTDEDAASWNRFKFRGHSMSEQTIGIIGFGNIGKLVYEKLYGFKPVKFYAYDPFITQDMLPGFDVTVTDLATLLKNSSVITLHLPLVEKTKHLINSETLKLMRDESILINASRGGIVNELELIDYAPNHKLTYVADVVENEPNPSEAIISSPNTIVTPHIASLTKSSEDAMTSDAIKNFLDNKPVTLT